MKCLFCFTPDRVLQPGRHCRHTHTDKSKWSCDSRSYPGVARLNVLTHNWWEMSWKGEKETKEASGCRLAIECRKLSEACLCQERVGWWLCRWWSKGKIGVHRNVFSLMERTSSFQWLMSWFWTHLGRTGLTSEFSTQWQAFVHQWKTMKTFAQCQCATLTACVTFLLGFLLLLGQKGKQWWRQRIFVWAETEKLSKNLFLQRP